MNWYLEEDKNTARKQTVRRMRSNIIRQWKLSGKKTRNWYRTKKYSSIKRLFGSKFKTSCQQAAIE